MQKPATIEEAWGRKYPEQVVLAITKNAGGRVNPMAIDIPALDVQSGVPLRIYTDDRAKHN